MAEQATKPHPETRITRMICPECGQPANTGMWGPECARYANHTPSASGLDRAVKCVPVTYVWVDAVVSALENAYHPQNPSAEHPADFVVRRFGALDPLLEGERSER